MKDLYIDSGITQSRAAVYNGKRIEEIYVENFDKINITGNIYKGRIENVVEGLNAVFVNIGFKKNAILQMDKKNVIGSFKKGQELIVQATREAVGQKGPKVTTDVSLPGKFIVLLPFEKRCHISKKIKNRESENYLKDIYSIFEEDGYGIIFRTECLEVSKEVVIKEYDYLKRVWQAISRGSEYLKAPGILFDSREFLNFVLREFVKQDIDSIHVGRKKDYEFLSSLIPDVYPEWKGKINYNEFDFRASSIIDAGIKELVMEKIPLSSGGYIVVNRTEALVSIDVNTGSYTGTNKKEDTVLDTNVEACSEIYRIIRLANLSGIILIDFIDMENAENRSKVMEYMEERFKYDRVPGKVHGFTNLGLLEISRSKKGKSIYENVFSDRRSSKYSTAFLLKELENDCVRFCRHYNKNSFEVLGEPALVDEIKERFSEFLKNMSEDYGIKLNFKKAIGVEGIILDSDKKEIDTRIEVNGTVIRGSLIDINEEENGLVIVKMKKNIDFYV